MNRFTEDQRMSRRIGLSLLGLCLLVILSGTARAASNDDMLGMDAQSLNPISRHEASSGPVLVCGGQSGHSGAGLRIRGTDVAAVWHSAYRMLVPRSALADSSSTETAVSRLPHKGPDWGFNISHGNAMVSIQTKW